MRRLLLLSWLCLSTILLFAQSRTITGKVTNKQTGVGLPAVTVSVKGTSQATQTNDDGTYSITVPATAKTLVFSSVGYGKQELAIGTGSSLSIGLEQTDAKNLDEVIVVAYGQQTKRKVTGAVSTVNAVDLENKPFSSVDQMLQGKVAGLQSISPTGQPGGIQQVRIRGIGSITAGAAPLYVVDGVPINTGDFSRVSNTSSTLAGINANDIESVTVLKDAAATSIYGSRAANGVILINTKKGKIGKSKIRFDGEFGLSNLAFLNDQSKPLTRDEYFNLTREGLVNAGATQAQIDNTLNSLGYNNTANEDWIDLVTRQGTTENVTASVSGGDAKTTFYTSVGFYDQQAVTIDADFRRYSGSFNIKHKATDRLSIGLNSTGSYSKEHSQSQGGNFRNPVLSAYFLRPSQNAYNADGTVNYSTTVFNQVYNPLAIEQYDRTEANIVKILANAFAEYQFYKDLKFTTKFAVDHFNIEEEQYYNPFFGDARTVGGRIYNYDTRVSNWLWSNLLNYRHDFLSNKDLGLDLTVGYEAQKSKTYQITARGDGLPATPLISLPAPGSPTSAAGARADYSFTSILSNLSLSYQSRYTLSGSLRRDGSSRFGSNNKYGTFWSVGAAWNIDQEAFFQDVRFVNALKLRASYGTNGNADIGNYTWKGSYAFGANYNQQPGSNPNVVDNPDLTWEVNKPFDVGMDVTVWNGRAALVLDFYQRKTTDLILADPLSPTSGFQSVQANVGSMENKGVEVQLNVTPVKSKTFSWDISFNWAYNKNKITSLRNNADILALPYIRRVGEDFQSIYTRLWAGVDPTNGAPLWYLDSTMKGTTPSVTTAKRAIIGSASPKGFGGFSNTFTYKNLSLSAQFTYQYGNTVYDQWGFISWSDGFNPQLNKIKKQLGRWQKAGDVTDIPKYVYGGTSNSNAESSRWYYKGDMIRLRDLTLNYTFPKKVLDAAKIESVRIYIRGTNLWTKAFDKDITFDPEQPINGANDLQIMLPRIVSIGVSLGF